MATVVPVQRSPLGSAFVQGLAIGQRQQRIDLAKARQDVMLGQVIDDPDLIRQGIARQKGVDVEEVDLSLTRSLAPQAPAQTSFQRNLAKGQLAQQQIIKDKFVNFINTDKGLSNQITREVNRRSGNSSDATVRTKVFDEIVNKRIREGSASASFKKFANKEFGSIGEFNRQSRVFANASLLQERVNRFNADPGNQLDVSRMNPAQLNPLILKDLNREVDAIKGSRMSPGQKINKILQRVRLANEDLRRSDDVFNNRSRRLDPRQFIAGIGTGRPFSKGKGKLIRQEVFVGSKNIGSIPVGENQDFGDPEVQARVRRLLNTKNIDADLSQVTVGTKTARKPKQEQEVALTEAVLRDQEVAQVQAAIRRIGFKFFGKAEGGGMEFEDDDVAKDFLIRKLSLPTNISDKEAARLAQQLLRRQPIQSISNNKGRRRIR
jgi:hypothetical protein